MATTAPASTRPILPAGHHPTRAARVAGYLTVVLVGALPRPVTGQQPAAGPGGPGDYVVSTPGEGRFALAVTGRPAPIYVDAAEDAGVRRAARSLQADLGRVTGTEPALAGGPGPGGRTVIVGTVGAGGVVDRLVREGALDPDAIEGRREAFLLEVLDRPLPGIDRALVIAGSDRRGTIFGVYDLSARIGVSPWYWWADVPPERHPDLYILPGRHADGGPAVRYRGIFINDEAPALSGWAHERFGGFNHRFYERVYELILRLKGNFLWPAMWGRSLFDDDSLSAALAHEYGVVLGTSHHEPMMRAHVEWERYGEGPWNYEENEARLRSFWRRGIERRGLHESLVTIGMRGDGDMPMSEEANIGLLERIVADQRTIIQETTGRPAAETPQVWALYKEVQEYYDRGMTVPDDVTLLFADDNWGNIRRLPDPDAAPRAGGYGVYYHFDYVGGPRNYKWINTTQISRVWEQMHLAWRHGVERIWVVNVGDIKPMELPISFFLEYAWDPDRWPAERLPEFTRRWAAQQFGRTHAPAIAEILTEYTRYNSRRKPELLSPDTWSLDHFREADRVLAEWSRLERKAAALRQELPERYHDAFYQLVQHPVDAAANLNRLYVTVARNRVYAEQGRAATNMLADSARLLFERDAEITRAYQRDVAGGKWNHMMAQTHIGYTSWQEPPDNRMPDVEEIRVPEPPSMGVAVEGSARWWPGPGGGAAAPGGGGTAALPTLAPVDRYGRQDRTIQVFNRGRAPFDFTVRTAEPWLRPEPSAGTLELQQPVRITVDWDRVPEGVHRVAIEIRGPANQVATVRAVVRNPSAPDPATVNGFVERDGYVSIEAGHFTRAVASRGLRWLRIPQLGRTLSGVTPVPVTAGSVQPGGDAPRLEYRMHLFDGGPVTVRAYVSPTLDYRGTGALRYGVSVDDGPVRVMNLVDDPTPGAWEQAVANNIRVGTSSHALDGPGAHVLKFWAVDPGVVLQKLVVARDTLPSSYLGPPESYHRPQEWLDLNKNGRLDPYEDPGRPESERIDDLLSRMTLEEKTMQLVTLYGFGRVLRDPLPRPEWDDELWKDGLANIDEQHNGVVETDYAFPWPEHVRALNEVQRWFVEETRLGVPVDFTNEGIRGLAHHGATSFPAQIGQASTWDVELIREIGAITGREARALGYTNIYSPILDLARDPRWGRTVETYGEDPFLVATLGEATVRGLQAEGVASTPKHFAVYGVPEGGRDGDARTAPHVTPRDMHELHLRPFRQAFAAGALGTMSSYNDWNGLPVTGSRYFLTDLLRREYGFQGYVVSDSRAVENLVEKHGVAADQKEAVRQSVGAGLNVRTDFTPPSQFVLPLRELVQEGAISEETLDSRVRDVLRVKLRLGLLDDPYVEPDAVGRIVRVPESLETSLRAARKSLVLLKNERGLLPLDTAATRSILVAGPLAAATEYAEGRYGANHLDVTSVLDGIREFVGPGVEVLHEPGVAETDDDWPESELYGQPPPDSVQAGIDAAARAARSADVVVAVLGGGNAVVGESRSRTSLDLPGHQRQLLQALHASGTPVVLVLINGRPLTINWADRHVPAILEAWFPSEASGQVVAEALFGAVNPGGKLPITFPRTVGQIPLAFPHRRASWAPEADWVGVDTRVNGPLYPFGHGLSYTTFEYAGLRVDPDSAAGGDTVTVSFQVTNTGDRTGDEVPQLYVRDAVASVTTWDMQLRGFQRITLRPGETRTVTMALGPEDLWLLDQEMRWAVEAGEFEVMVGASSADMRLRGSFTVTGTATFGSPEDGRPDDAAR